MKTNTSAQALLCAALRGQTVPMGPDMAAMIEYHGIGPLLLARSRPSAQAPYGEPYAFLRPQARARAMWEIRHRHILTQLLSAMAGAAVPVLVIKGTALAYDLYPEAVARPRGDSDLLVSQADLDAARKVLRRLEFTPFYADDADTEEGRYQEIWSITTPDGAGHDIDLHWKALNSAVLDRVVPVEEAFAEAIPLPCLAPGAMALSHPLSLLHAVVHRAKHIVSPYFVDGERHTGGDRLIWLCDIDLLARALTPPEWELVTQRARDRGIAPVLHEALTEAAELLDTPLPTAAIARLAAAAGGRETAFLLKKGRLGRALSDAGAAGWRAGLGRLFPPAEYMRMKYPGSRQPVPLLWLRRIAGLVIGGRA